jgi:hypothetical protein
LPFILGRRRRACDSTGAADGLPARLPSGVLTARRELEAVAALAARDVFRWALGHYRQTVCSGWVPLMVPLTPRPQAGKPLRSIGSGNSKRRVVDGRSSGVSRAIMSAFN